MTKHFLTFLFAILLSITSFSQEITRPLTISIEQAELYKAERSFPDRELRSYRDGGITLPFIDDFSRYSLPTNNPEIPADWQLWTDNTARINSSLPINPPTKGVATLDGLDETGYPHDFSGQFTYGAADTLTSCPIDLSGKTAADSVKLIFHYQSGGFGNEADFQDELVLEFLVPNSDPPLWQEAWSTPGVVVTDFQRVFVHVNDALWLQSDFQFRFRNYATLSGNFDHWHIDYVWLDDDVVDAEFKIIDVSANGHSTSLLNGLHNMPWTHYQNAPSSIMSESELVQFRNLDEDRNITFGSKVFYDGAEIADLPQGLNTALNGFSTFGQPYSTNDGSPNSFVYPSDVNDTCATFKVQHFCTTTPDLNAVNDTLTFEQHFSNYYAYDDGTAEGAYALNDEGSSMAMRYTNYVQDTLLGLLIHFNPFGLNQSDETFLLRAWHNNGGEPGDEIQENFVLHQPDYYHEGNDVFQFYEYDEPILIPEGEFHVGIVQTTSAELNVGYDKQFNANGDKLHYKLGAFGSWAQSGVSGSLMIRPVFQSDKELGWDFVDVNEIQKAKTISFNVYPNPAEDRLVSEEFVAGRTVRILNLVGAVVKEELLQSSELFVGDLALGTYVVQVIENELFVGNSKFIKK